jgi:hypothetical protein
VATPFFIPPPAPGPPPPPPGDGPPPPPPRAPRPARGGGGGARWPARAAGAPIIHVVHRGRAGGLFDPNGRMFQIHIKAAPGPGEKIIEKELPNAFAKTALHLALQATERKSLILAGFMTHMCVSATARAALDHGWKTTVMGDATATRDLPDPLGGDPVTAAVLQRAGLAELADRFATVARAGDLT